MLFLAREIGSPNILSAICVVFGYNPGDRTAPQAQGK